MEMNIRILIETMFLLLLLIITGYIVSKIHILTEETTKKLSELIVRVTCPALIIGAVFKQDEVGDKGVNILSILGLGVILYLSYILIATIVVKFFKLKNNEKPIYELMLIFNNTSFVGIPVVKVLYGDAAIFYLTILHLSFNFLIYTYGVIKMKPENENIKFSFRSIFNSGVIAALLGIVIYFLKIPLPNLAVNYLMTLGEVTIPLSLLLMGASLGKIPLKKVFTNRKLILFCLLKLLVLPVFFYFVFSLFVKNRFYVELITISTALPAGSMIIMFSLKYNKEVIISSLGVFLTTIFSIVTLPIIIYLLKI